MQHKRHQRREMAQEVILFPEGGPGEIQEQRAHFKQQHNRQCTQDSIHSYGSTWIIVAGVQRAGFWSEAIRSATSR